MTKNLKLIFICLFMVCFLSVSGQVPDTYKNPILSGYHPDPSICRVGDTYYMVNSSFEWYPAMPVHKSKDLVNWELVGYGGTNPEKLAMPEGIRNSGGIYAVTIRHHDGLFYLITTHIGGGGNFYVTTTDPSKEWSEPVWLDAPGIDPSLFWDDDGRCYYIGHGNLDEKQDWPNQQGAWMQELDLKAGKLVGPRKQLTHGHSATATWTEGPHLYKVDGKYVLIVSEGGTGHYHAVSQFYSDNLWGPYQASEINPILSHRHLGNDSPIKCTGHADFVQTQNGEWWMVALAVRNFDGESYLARETFLVPMDFEKTYDQMTIIVNKGYGKILEEQKRPNLPWTPVAKDPQRDEFNNDKLALKWNMLRSPNTQWYELKDGLLTMDVRPEQASKFVNPSLLAQRLRDRFFTLSTKMTFNSKAENEEAGLILYRSSEDYILFTKVGKDIVLTAHERGEVKEIFRTKAPAKELVLTAKCDGRNISFEYESQDTELSQIETTLPLLIIGEGRGGQFNGPMVGIYASSNGKNSKSKAIFDWVEYY